MKGAVPPFTAQVCPCALLLARREVLAPRLEGFPFARLTIHHPVPAGLSALWGVLELCNSDTPYFTPKLLCCL
nr:MAG TPA: hypothetical protein [Caudoviricetes sp.]